MNKIKKKTLNVDKKNINKTLLKLDKITKKLMNPAKNGKFTQKRMLKINKKNNKKMLKPKLLNQNKFFQKKISNVNKEDTNNGAQLKLNKIKKTPINSTKNKLPNQKKKTLKINKKINNKTLKKIVKLPNPNELFPLKCGLKCTCYLKPLSLSKKDKIKNIEIGDFTYSYPDFFEHVLHHYEWQKDKLKIGKFCQIGKQVKFFMNGCNHKYDCVSTFGFQIFKHFNIEGDMKPSIFDTIKGDTIIGNDVWIGDYVTIMPGIKIGNGVIIATNSHVVKDVPSYCVIGGNPAKIIRKRFDDELIDLMEKLKWWNLPIKKIINLVPILISSDLDHVKKEIKKILK